MKDFKTLDELLRVMCNVNLGERSNPNPSYVSQDFRPNRHTPARDPSRDLGQQRTPSAQHTAPRKCFNC